MTQDIEKAAILPQIVLIDARYGNNTSFLKALEERKLKYLGGVAKASLGFVWA